MEADKNNIEPAEHKPPAPGGIRGLWNSFLEIVHWLIDLDEGLDRESTIANIKNNKRMRGANAWLLMCSIMIASLGLDMNSPAIIIGAMLISPLMSPILGMGLSVGTNDKEMLRVSTKHFGIAIAIALVTSYIYFSINPMGLESPTPEIASRTRPTLLDSLVAIFGGFAGIISSSRKDKTSAIPGVAIATALMPPLCVSGYGLATGNMSILINSFYLFFLNSFFVALSTYLMVRYLKFPVRKFVDIKERRRTIFILAVFSLALILPSAKILYDVYQVNKENRAVNNLVNTYFGEYSDPKCVEYTYTKGDSSSILILELVGKPLSDSLEQIIEFELQEQINASAQLYIFESTEPALNKLSRLEAQLMNFENLSYQLEIAKQAREKSDEERAALTQKLDSIRSDTIPFKRISNECDILFDNLEEIQFARASREGDSGKPFTIPTFYLRWKSGISRNVISRDEEKVRAYLLSRTDLDTLDVQRLR